MSLACCHSNCSFMCLVFCKPTVLVKVPLENSHWCFWFVNFNFMLPPNISSSALMMSGFHSGWSQRYSVPDNRQPCLCREVWNSFKSGGKARSFSSQQAQGRLLPDELLMLILSCGSHHSEVAFESHSNLWVPAGVCWFMWMPAAQELGLCEAWEKLISKHRKRGKAAWWLGGEARSQKHSSRQGFFSPLSGHQVAFPTP